MRGALGSHMDLRRRQRDWQPIIVWDFTTMSPGGIVMPTGMTFTRASSRHSVQIDANTLVTSGLATDVPAVGRLSSAHSLGLFVEPARTNLYGYSRTASVAPGTAGHSCTYTTGRTGPDGSTNAIRGQTPSGGYSRFQSLAAVTGAHTLSAWARAGLGSGAYQLVAAYSGTIGAAVQGTAGADWSRVASASFSYPAASVPNPNPWDGRANGTLGSAAAARDCDLDFIQFEAGLYPSSAIVTSAGATATRAGERPGIDGTAASSFLRNGRLGICLELRMLAARSEIESAGGTLLYWPQGDGTVFVDAATGYLYAYNVSPQSQTANGAIDWARYDKVVFAIEVGNGRTSLRWRTNGGSVSTANFSVHDDSLAAIDTSGGIDVCNALGGFQMPCIVEKIIPFVPGRAPF